ncbi:MAG: hypothetical protein HC825_08485 [Oscillatoriales cyanobacterium RM1_1_9]|nr:hypothetical protein [Oscillatoriales cyanobacterium RM1_1_9]
MLLELSRMALSDSPRLPENLAQRALLLMETAQDLQEKLVDLRAETDPEVASPEMEIANPGLLLSNLRTQLNLMRDRHPHRDNPDWQNLFIALDEVEQYYRHLNQ